MKAPRLWTQEPILVAMDFSACSRNALDYAVALATPSRTRLVLLHVIELYPIDYLFGLKTEPEQCRQVVVQAQRELERWGCRCAGALEIQTAVRLGKPFKEILKAAQEYGVQLVVMGTHGYAGLLPVRLGSTAERVVRLSPCPVLVIPTLEEEFVWEDMHPAGGSAFANPRPRLPTLPGGHRPAPSIG